MAVVSFARDGEFASSILQESALPHRYSELIQGDERSIIFMMLPPSLRLREAEIEIFAKAK